VKNNQWCCGRGVNPSKILGHQKSDLRYSFYKIFGAQNFSFALKDFHSTPWQIFKKNFLLVEEFSFKNAQF